MKLAFFSRTPSDRLDAIVDHATSLGAECIVNPCEYSGIDVAVSFGGDGTFLGVARGIGANGVPIFGINNGRLGFLASCPLDGAIEAIEALVGGDVDYERRSLISVVGLGESLNEFTIQKRDSGMVYVTIAVDSHSPYSFWADGVIVSTPTGSTAYSLSVGGAIVAPDCDCFIVSPIAPHNLNVRPMIVGGGSVIRVTVNTRDGVKAFASLDNRQFEAADGASFDMRKSDRSVQIVRLKGNSFYKTLRDKLSWSVDPRL